MRPDTAAPTKTHTYLLAEPSLPDMFSGQVKLLYVKKDNPTLGQRLKNFILKPLMIVAAKASLLNVLRGSAFKDNEEAQRLTNHIKELGFFQGVSTFKVTDFLVDAALHGSRLAPTSDTTSNAEQFLADLTGAALNEHLNNPGYMYATLQEYLGETAKGLVEFHSFHADPFVQLNETQIAKINELKKNMAELKSDTKKSKRIPDEVFTKFFEIYEDFSSRQKAKDLILGVSNLIDRLSEINPAATSLEFFLSFFDANPTQFEESAYLPLAKNFEKNLEQLKSDLDSYGIDESMRATLDILAKEFIAHIQNPEHPWKTAEAVKILNLELKAAREH